MSSAGRSIAGQRWRYGWLTIHALMVLTAVLLLALVLAAAEARLPAGHSLSAVEAGWSAADGANAHSQRRSAP